MCATADPTERSAAPLWARVRNMFARAIIAIGQPAAIAAIGQLTRALRRDIACRVAQLETIVRKLLFVEAARLQREPPPGWSIVPAQNNCAPEGARSNLQTSRTELDPSQPHTWPARFSVAPPRDPCAIAEHSAPRIRALWGPAPPLTTPPPPRAARTPGNSTLRLAMRLEAVRRVLDDPLQHAWRLARLFRRLIRRYPEAPRRLVYACAQPHSVDGDDPPPHHRRHGGGG